MDSLTKSNLSKLLNFSSSMNEKLFLVGGTLRSILSHNPCSDFDLTGKNRRDLFPRLLILKDGTLSDAMGFLN